MKEKINFEEFLSISNRLEIKVGEILTIDAVPKSDKMIRLSVSFGDGDTRTVMSNIGNRVDVDNLVGIQLPFITNLEPVKIMGVVSEAMIMVGETVDGNIEINEFTNGVKLL